MKRTGWGLRLEMIPSHQVSKRGRPSEKSKSLFEGTNLARDKCIQSKNADPGETGLILKMGSEIVPKDEGNVTDQPKKYESFAHRFAVLQKMVVFLSRGGPATVKLSLLEKALSSVLRIDSEIRDIVLEMACIAPELIKITSHHDPDVSIYSDPEENEHLYLILTSPPFKCNKWSKKKGQRDSKELSRIRYFEERLKEYLADPRKTEIRKDKASRNTSEPCRKPKDMEELLEQITKQEFYCNQIVTNSVKVREVRNPVTADIPDGIINPTLDIKSAFNIERLYMHQSRAIESFHNGYNIVLNTSTSSGKSLVYQVAIINSLIKDKDFCCIVIFPTKALIQDQKKSLEMIMCRVKGLEEIKVYTYDGDSSREERRLIRNNSRVIFTNPDIIHCSLLPNHHDWNRILSNTKLIVLDELHCYTGDFGSNVSVILKRLRRVCSLYNNNNIMYIGCSATAPKSDDLFVSITGVNADRVDLIDEDYSPSGKQTFIMWMCSKNNTSELTESENLALFLATRGLSSIFFTKTRSLCEILYSRIRQHFIESGYQDFAKCIRSYRGGYIANVRRSIEQDIFEEKALCIVATSALELGVNIGNVDVIVHVGLPYDASSYVQRCGRAGRRCQESLVIMVLDSKRPDCATYINSPWKFHEDMTPHIKSIGKSIKSTVKSHIECIAYEIPVQVARDSRFFSIDPHDLLEMCESKLIGCPDNDLFFVKTKCDITNPAFDLSIRGPESEEWRIFDLDTGKVVDVLSQQNSLFTIYEQSVFLLRGKTFLVKNICHEDRICTARSVAVPYITFSRDYTDVNPVLLTHRIVVGSCVREIDGYKEIELNYGEVQVTTKVFGYTKRCIRTQKCLGTELISDSIPYTKTCCGAWLNLPAFITDRLKENIFSIPHSIHAAEHVLIRGTICFTGNTMEGYPLLQTECRSPLDKRDRPNRLTLYDTSLSREQLSYRFFSHFKKILSVARDNILSCECCDGCKTCICLDHCKENNQAINKLGAKLILMLLYEYCVEHNCID